MWSKQKHSDISKFLKIQFHFPFLLSLIVSDPLIQSQNKRGQVYNCDVNQGSCSPIPINVPPEAVNMSLGLSMTKDPQTSNTVVCGPTIPIHCKQFTAYNGMCFTLNPSNFPSQPMPRQLRDCPLPTDIAFLMDGSGSVHYLDFFKMKTFIISMVNAFQGRDYQFAVAQYSIRCEIHINFNSFSNTDQIERITQFGGGTYTANAIQKVVNEVFTIQAGAREKANRVLVVITDGQSHDRNDLPSAANSAEKKKIIRYAIGVGGAFDSRDAENELKTIASDPDAKHVFKVNDFSVLEEIRNALEETIIAIEGTKTTGESAKMEFAQDGFSADFFQNGQIIMGAVGAFQWKGGYQMYNRGEPSGTFQKGDNEDSYLGYSMTVANVRQNNYIIQGAPRNNHTGKVIISDTTGTVHSLDSPEPQIGAYYGAELCVVDLDSNTFSDLLLVSAPLYNEGDQEGKVFVYTFMKSQVKYIQVLKGTPGKRGRFGMTLASPADLNRDGKMDVVVGAPLEDNGLGSIYIFNGRNADIAPTHSQRISGSSVRSGLQYFGISLSQSSLDHSQDQLPDLAVGSKGAVTLLRSRPIVDLRNTLTYSPSKIPTRDTVCTSPLRNTLKLCFTMDRLKNDPQSDLNANINYTIKLDAKRQSYRAYFSEKIRDLSRMISVSLQGKCDEHNFFIEACPNDALNPIINELVYTFEGLPSQKLGNLRPMLLPTVKYTSDYNLDFEINCGTDNICIDNLKVDFNFSGHSVIQVGIMQEMNVTVFIQNRGENSYNSRVILKYPFGLSFRRFTTKQATNERRCLCWFLSEQGRLECVSVDSEEKAVLGKTTCYISKPILKKNDLLQASEACLSAVSPHCDESLQLRFSSSEKGGYPLDNDEHERDNELSKDKSIDVKYAIYVALIRDLNVDIFIRVPVKLGDKDIWTNTVQSRLTNPCRVWMGTAKAKDRVARQPHEGDVGGIAEMPVNDHINMVTEQTDQHQWGVQEHSLIPVKRSNMIPGCNLDRHEKPKVTDFVVALQKKPELNCSIAVCAVYKCAASLTSRQLKFYNISGNVSSGWIEQTGFRSAIFMLTSTATMDYNRTEYIYFASDSVNTEPAGKIDTQVEVYEEKFPLKETIGGVVGGLVLLALIAAGLYKAGFFKSNYKKMLEEAGAGAEGTANGAEALTED
ncbi:integrin alpha-X-like [Silurus asotus]|uniref:Integrin alpha-X-like n=1 Tax=Silurus asotus TaxID=30991 RepID=A0AAD5FAQ6_SILAS|nr:integrin alpha-X-like [Silurus asotus]